MFPVRLDVAGLNLDDAFEGGPAAGAAIKAIKEQLAAIPNMGMGYGLLRYLNPETGPELPHFLPGEISFNYLGRFGGEQSGPEVPWAPVDLDFDAPLDADQPMLAPIDINAIVRGDKRGSEQLSATFAFAPGMFSRDEIAELSDLWVQALRGLATHSGSASAGGHTPTDFGLVEVSQSDIDTWDEVYAGTDEAWPLAPLQSGLLFHSMLAEGSVDVYTTQVVISLGGKVDGTRLRGAAQAMVDRYPNLRAAFVTTGAGLPVQVLPLHGSIPWSDVAGGDVQAMAEAERMTPFDLTKPPLIRFALVRQPGAEPAERPDDAAGSSLIVTLHHILADGWSMPLLLKDLLTLYALRGDASVLPPVRSYRSYLEWLSQQDHDASINAWREAFAGVEEPTLVAGVGNSGSSNTHLTEQSSLSGELHVEMSVEDTADADRFRCDGGCNDQHDCAGVVGSCSSVASSAATTSCLVRRCRVVRATCPASSRWSVSSSTRCPCVSLSTPMRRSPSC